MSERFAEWRWIGLTDPTGQPVLAAERAKPANPAPAVGAGEPTRPSRGLVTILIATALLFAVCWLVQPASLSRSSFLGMLPFAAVLAIVAVGQTLVVQQGGIDLSVPGLISISVVIATHQPNGDNGKLPAAVLFGYAVALAAGLLNGLIVSRIGMSPIVTTLGTNALLYAGVLGISGGTPRNTTSVLHAIAAGKLLVLPHAVYFAVAITAAVGFVVKRAVVGRRFEAVGARPPAARSAGLAVRRHQLAAYVSAALLYATAGILLGGIVTAPSAFQGETYLLPSVAAVVLGGTSLLGGKGSPVASAVAALFLSQLDQFVLTLGVNSAVQNLVEAGALAAGVGVYTVNWPKLRGWLGRAGPDHSGSKASAGSA
jgi:ribose transport system permease protein